MSQTTLKEGRWRVLLHADTVDIPFSLEISHTKNQYEAHIINGDERLLLEDITIQGDTITFPLHIFDASLVGKIEGDTIKGFFLKYFAPDKKQAFTATYGQDFRFPINDIAPQKEITGKWEVTFQRQDGKITPALGQFSQEGNKVTGTFLTATGDYRFLEGVMQGTILRLSSFDGNNAFLFVANLEDDNRLKGKFFSGKTHIETWIGKSNPEATLPDAYQMTYLKEGYEKLAFSLPDLDGNMVSLEDDRFQNKVVIVQIFASWCPNCMDLTAFMADWYANNQEQPIEIISLAFERKNDFAYAKRMLQKVIKRYKIQYPFVVAGSTDKEEANKLLPMLSPIKSFPTIIFIDKKGKVRHIYTGFSGPSTGEYYIKLKKSFDMLTSELINE